MLAQEGVPFSALSARIGDKVSEIDGESHEVILRRLTRTPRRQRIAVCFIGIRLGCWNEHFVSCGCVFLSHQDLESRAGPRNVLTHSANRVRRK